MQAPVLFLVRTDRKNKIPLAHILEREFDDLLAAHGLENACLEIRQVSGGTELEETIRYNANEKHLFLDEANEDEAEAMFEIHEQEESSDTFCLWIAVAPEHDPFYKIHRGQTNQRELGRRQLKADSVRLRKIFRNQSNIVNYFQGQRRTPDVNNPAVTTIKCESDRDLISAAVEAVLSAKDTVSSDLWVVACDNDYYERIYRTLKEDGGRVREAYGGGVHLGEGYFDLARCAEKRVVVTSWTEAIGFEAETVVVVGKPEGWHYKRGKLLCTRATIRLIHVTADNPTFFQPQELHHFKDEST